MKILFFVIVSLFVTSSVVCTKHIRFKRQLRVQNTQVKGTVSIPELGLVYDRGVLVDGSNSQRPLSSQYNINTLPYIINNYPRFPKRKMFIRPRKIQNVYIKPKIAQKAPQIKLKTHFKSTISPLSNQQKPPTTKLTKTQSNLNNKLNALKDALAASNSETLLRLLNLNPKGVGNNNVLTLLGNMPRNVQSTQKYAQIRITSKPNTLFNRFNKFQARPVTENQINFQINQQVNPVNNNAGLSLQREYKNSLANNRNIVLNPTIDSVVRNLMQTTLNPRKAFVTTSSGGAWLPNRMPNYQGSQNYPAINNVFQKLVTQSPLLNNAYTKGNYQSMQDFQRKTHRDVPINQRLQKSNYGNANVGLYNSAILTPVPVNRESAAPVYGNYRANNYQMYANYPQYAIQYPPQYVYPGNQQQMNYQMPYNNPYYNQYWNNILTRASQASISPQNKASPLMISSKATSADTTLTQPTEPAYVWNWLDWNWVDPYSQAVSSTKMATRANTQGERANFNIPPSGTAAVSTSAQFIYPFQQNLANNNRAKSSRVIPTGHSHSATLFRLGSTPDMTGSKFANINVTQTATSTVTTTLSAKQKADIIQKLLTPPFSKKDYEQICRHMNETYRNRTFVTFGPINKDCAQFVRCNVFNGFFYPNESSCTFGFWYDAGTGYCVDSDAITRPCIYNPCTSLAGQSANLPYPGNCRAYFSCEGNSATAELCDGFANFDPTMGRCCPSQMFCPCSIPGSSSSNLDFSLQNFFQFMKQAPLKEQLAKSVVPPATLEIKTGTCHEQPCVSGSFWDPVHCLCVHR